MNLEEAPAPERSKIIQLHNKFILTHIKSGFMVIDQYRAHQRVLYEQLTLASKGKQGSQQLLFPLLIELGKNEVELVESFKEELTDIGFSFESFGNDSISINGVPNKMKEEESKEVFHALLESLSHGDMDGKEKVENKSALALARQLAIRAGERLDEREMEHLVDELFACEMPYHLPNGKPIVITLPLEELNKRFQY